MESTRNRPREKALVLIHRQAPDRPYIEIYGERHLDVLVRDVPFIGTKSGERLAEEFTEFALPGSYRQLYWPGNLRAQAPVKLVQPSDVVDIYQYRQLLRGLDAVANPAEEVLEWST